MLQDMQRRARHYRKTRRSRLIAFVVLAVLVLMVVSAITAPRLSYRVAPAVGKRVWETVPGVLPANSVYDLAKLLHLAPGGKHGDPAGNTRVSRSSSPEFVPQWERQAASLVKDIFDVDVSLAQLVVPPAFEKKAVALFPALTGGPKQVLSAIERQHVVTVTNRVTAETTYFNEIRRFRPGAEQPLSAEAEREIRAMYDLGANPDDCDFCSRVRTAQDRFGRVEGRLSYSAANIAKMGRWHALIVSKHHNPIDYTEDDIVDMLELSNQWFTRVVEEESSYLYWNVACDIGKRASASQVHLHFQLTAGKAGYATGFQRLYLDAARYAAAHNSSSYWDALIAAHATAGLALTIDDAHVLAYLSPAKEKEVMVIAPELSSGFTKAVALVMTALRDAGQARAMSFGMALPPVVAPVDGDVPDMPAVFRVIDRGNPLDPRGDTGAFEYYGSPYVGADPYRVMSWLKAAWTARQTADDVVE